MGKITKSFLSVACIAIGATSPVLASDFKCTRVVDFAFGNGKILGYSKGWNAGMPGSIKRPSIFKPTGKNLETRSMLVWEEGYCRYY